VNKTILIAPFDGPVAAALAAEAHAAGWATALALAGETESRPQKDEPADRLKSLRLAYNPASFISVSSMILQARNTLGSIDAAILLGNGMTIQGGFGGDRPGELGAAVERHSIGPLFVARELCRIFDQQRAGRILLLAPERPRDAAIGAAASLVAGAFEGLGTGLFTMAESAPWKAFGIFESGGAPERVARFALATLEDPKASRAGRWIRHTGKAGIFGAS